MPVFNQLLKMHRTAIHNAAVIELELFALSAKDAPDKETRRLYCRNMVRLERIIADIRNKLGLVNEAV